MSNAFSQIYLHTVFSTKKRQPVLDAEKRDVLFRYIWGIHNNIGCKLLRIGGVEDHIHMLASLPTTTPVADYMQDVKANSSKWLKEEKIFAAFKGWQDGYGAFSVSPEHRGVVIEYIKNQPEHHRTESFMDEYKRLLAAAEIEYDEQYL
jgi:putative transposase